MCSEYNAICSLNTPRAQNVLSTETHPQGVPGYNVQGAVVSWVSLLFKNNISSLDNGKLATI